MESFVNENSEVIGKTIHEFNTCPILESPVLAEKLAKIQEIINSFNIRCVSNLNVWVPELN
jgi:hypothetical protein